MQGIKNLLKMTVQDKHILWSRLIFDISWFIALGVLSTGYYIAAFVVTAAFGFGKEFIDMYYEEYPWKLPNWLRNLGISGSGFDWDDIIHDGIGIALGTIDIIIITILFTWGAF